LTRKGRAQASALPALFSSAEELDSIELVVSSPLTRALHTSLLAFPNKNIIVNYDLRELGTGVPQNIPRKTEDVKDLERPLRDRDESLWLDADSLRPTDWPDLSPSGSSPNKGGDERIQRALQWLYKQREESTIAVVCHYNVIRRAVQDGQFLRPANATPIRCYLRPSGELVVALAEPDK
jgi:broad specificity phosphatase PhoE